MVLIVASRDASPPALPCYLYFRTKPTTTPYISASSFGAEHRLGLVLRLEDEAAQNPVRNEA